MEPKINSALYIMWNSDRSFFSGHLRLFGVSDMHKYCERHAVWRNYVNLSGHCSATRCAADIVSAICFNLRTSGSNVGLGTAAREGGAANKRAQNDRKITFHIFYIYTVYIQYRPRYLSIW